MEHAGVALEVVHQLLQGLIVVGKAGQTERLFKSKERIQELEYNDNLNKVGIQIQWGSE